MRTILYHHTHRDNVSSIMTHGLKMTYARNQRLPWVWLDCEPSETLASHVATQHGWQREDIVVLCVEIEREHCITHPLNVTFGGLAYKTRRDISPESIVQL